MSDKKEKGKERQYLNLEASNLPRHFVTNLPFVSLAAYDGTPWRYIVSVGGISLYPCSLAVIRRQKRYMMNESELDISRISFQRVTG